MDGKRLGVGSELRELVLAFWCDVPKHLPHLLMEDKTLRKRSYYVFIRLVRTLH